MSKRGPSKPEATKEQLIEMYTNDPFASAKSVGEIFGVHHETVRRWLKYYGIPVKSRNRSKVKGLAGRPLANKEWLKEQLDSGKTMKGIAAELGVKPARVSYWALKHGLNNPDKSAAIKEALAKRYPNGRRPEEAANWKGGRSVHGSGYVSVYAPDHPHARSKRVFEHRLVMEQYLGRYLEPNEIVHHIDGNKQNNAIENLQLTHQKEHVASHWQAGHEVKAWKTLAHELLHRVEELERRVTELEAKNK